VEREPDRGARKRAEPGPKAAARPGAEGNQVPSAEYPNAMSYLLISDPSALQELLPRIRSRSRIALDCEAAGFHRYSDRLCLVQLTAGPNTYLLDPLGTDLAPVLKPILENPGIEVVMHGADYDLRLLHRDLGIGLKGLWDTQVAASLLGEPAIGLASLLEEHLGVTLAKKHQKADWATRPLADELLDYAAEDTRHLDALRDVLAGKLDAVGRTAWAEEEFAALEEVQWETETVDPVTRVKAARTLGAREVTALRSALAWRDSIARSRDRAPFRVVGDSVLLAVVQERPTSVEELASMKGMSPRLARQEGAELLRSLSRADDLPEDQLQPYPKPNRGGTGRPTPEEEQLAERIRSLRTAKAEALGLDRGVVLSNAQISEIVRVSPDSTEALRAVPGLRRWQADILEEEVMAILP